MVERVLSDCNFSEEKKAQAQQVIASRCIQIHEFQRIEVLLLLLLSELLLLKHTACSLLHYVLLT